MRKDNTAFKLTNNKHYNRGLDEGVEKGELIGVLKGILMGSEMRIKSIVTNMITKQGFTDEQAAAAVEVSIEHVQDVRAKLKNRDN